MKVPLYWLLYLTSFTLSAQNVTLREVCTLPPSLAETSGLEISGPNQFWTHNDSGGDAAIYAFDTLGTITRTVRLSNATHTDWEDITSDINGNLYIGDFGNSFNNRENLRIYKISSPLATSANSLSAGVIQFRYPDQKAFPPADAQKNFDAEAMVFFNDSLYVFSKNLTVPFSGYTKLYRLPAQPGIYTAALVDSFYTGTDAISGQITAAAFSPDKKRLALLSYSKIYMFSAFTGSRFFKGSVTQYTLNGLSQKEGIAFADNCTIYVTDEEYLGTGRKLYQATICSEPTGLKDLRQNPALAIKSIYPNPSVDQVTVHYQLPPLLPDACLLVYNGFGRQVSRICLTSSAETVVFPVKDWTAGIYYCRIETGTHTGPLYRLAVIR